MASVPDPQPPAKKHLTLHILYPASDLHPLPSIQPSPPLSCLLVPLRPPLPTASSSASNTAEALLEVLADAHSHEAAVGHLAGGLDHHLHGLCLDRLVEGPSRHDPGTKTEKIGRGVVQSGGNSL